ncbi:MAG: ATP-binding cassette domain-containing protein [Verrucomicrobiae bacterium]|nr:ATP-binding cassette domain-containing protein [Verrucomicrobiae bacterium]
MSGQPTGGGFPPASAPGVRGHRPPPSTPGDDACRPACRPSRHCVPGAAIPRWRVSSPSSSPDPATPSRPRVESLRQALRIFRHLHPYRRRFAGSLVALLLASSLGLAFPYLTGRLLDASTQPVLAGGGNLLNRLALLLVATLAVQAFFSFFSSYGFNRCGESALADLRRETFGRLLGLPMAFFARRRVGELSSRLSADLTVIQETLTGTVPQFLRQSVLLTGGIVLIITTSWRLGAVMISTFPVLLLAAVLIGRRIRALSRTAQDHLAEGGTVVEESLHGIVNVKAFGNERFELARYSRHLADFLGVILQTARLRASLVSFIIFGVFGSIVLVFWFGARLMQAGEMTFGELTRFILYTTFVGGSVASFAEVFSQMQKTLGATERVRELLDETPEIPMTSGASSGPVPRLRGEVRFDAVEFRYPSRPDVAALQRLTLHAAPGERIALVGPSGAGKSTIVSLLLRLYEPTSGRLFLDGRPADTYPLPTVRGNMAIVPQEVLLFGGSIEENIRYGKPDATAAEVHAAARRAACHEFIERFPEGYQTRVGDRGVKLSGGQRQRIAIARALLKDPAILILDEATSSLDSESERLVQEALGELLAGRTAFVVAHRLSTVRQVDRIYVIEDGTVTESGSHDLLMARPGGTYRRLAALQFQEPAAMGA